MICAAPGISSSTAFLSRWTTLRFTGIVGSPKAPPLHWVVNEGGETRRIVPPATHHLGGGEAIIAAAVGGFGICQMPSSLVRRHIASGELTPVVSDLSTAPVDIHAVWPKQAHLSPRVHSAVDQLVPSAARGRLD